MPSPVCFLEREGWGKALYGITSVFFPRPPPSLFLFPSYTANGSRMTLLPRIPPFYFRHKKTPPAVRQTGPYLWFPAMYFCG
ncbi:hypothetical protein DFS30_08075 [Akkermansia muciniphila]|nr:hypothetical protein [Akkermansia muciniphila]PNC72201.1 hypothetical protein CXU05_03180 [Akkermansia muciniphila]PNC76258.1 hypothetical protein CXT98_03550 [Akkermansia muciniphila]PNC79799.1 hypothetical protein CXU01_07865 [Akkermansia muciniphila]PNC89626.1 hypothetical protein CXU03_05520 [Akkermansia muciniphila]